MSDAGLSTECWFIGPSRELVDGTNGYVCYLLFTIVFYVSILLIKPLILHSRATKKQEHKLNSRKLKRLRVIWRVKRLFGLQFDFFCVK